MGKLVVLKLGEGDFERGFPVTLQIGVDGCHPFVETTGRLPPGLEILEHYGCWQSAYCRLGVRLRLSAPEAQVTNVSVLNDCSSAAQVLSNSLNAWLNSEPFRSIREKLLEKLMPSDEVRVVLQAEDHQLRRLPWHLWDFFERYPKAELALSTPVYERAETPSFPREKVRILAILGSSNGINVQADRALLEQLPGAEIKFLVEPQLKELTDQLWEQGWDILFFAGHSSSQANGEAGRIYINQTDSLTIYQLKYALKKGIERGLKLAIFNSCDGLGLAYSLAELSIPQLIVMREPVPDRVAHEFLKYFLAAFAGGEPFYLAVREARQRLQGLENQFPCATWLPIICQNPAEGPLTWQELRGKTERDVQPAYGNSPRETLRKRQTGVGRRSLWTVLLASVTVTAFVMGIRQLGVLQSLELQAFDQLLRRRSPEGPDSRIMVVTVTEADIQAQNQEPRRGSLSDRSLSRLLEKLEQYQPRAIGLDIYRDYTVGSNYQDLAARLRQTDHLVGVCKVSDPQANDPGVKPPPEIPEDRLGFSDVVKDPDGILRRHLLTLTPEDPASPCVTPYAFSVQLAARYLAAKGILPKFTSEGHLQFGGTVLKPLEPHTGTYQQVDTWGYQVLLNYRSSHSPQSIAPQVTLTQVLTGKVNPSLVKDRIILIGVTDKSYPDYLSTPYGQQPGQEMPGVVVQAQMVSQILSAVLDQRPLMWFWPQWGEVLWIWGWSLLGGILAWRFRSLLGLGLAVGIALGALYGLCFGLLTQSGWVPLIPSALALITTGGVVVIYRHSLTASGKYLESKS